MSADVDYCTSCGKSSDEGNLGWSEVREELVCSGCIGHLVENGYYPDEDGPEQRGLPPTSFSRREVADE